MTTTEDSSTAHKSHSGAYVGYVLIALVVYALSIGPAWWLGMNGYISIGALDTIYFPIGYLTQNTFLREPIEWYLGLWVPILFPPSP